MMNERDIRHQHSLDHPGNERDPSARAIDTGRQRRFWGRIDFAFSMSFSIDGTILRLPNSGTGRIRQDGLARDMTPGGRDAMIADLRIEREGLPELRGRLRFASEAYVRFPGKDDVEKSSAVARRLIGWVAENGLIDGFFLRIDADDNGVQIADASR
jgi:hypothetical protein